MEKNEKDAPVADLQLSGTSLNKAIAEADTQKIDKLISKGVNIDKANRKKVSPIHVAAYYANLEMLKLLLSKGANPNVMTTEGHMVLAYAFFGFEFRSNSTRQELMDVIETLVKGGADVNLKNPHGGTVIYLAALLGYTPIIEFLLDHGADVNTIAEGGVTPLIAAMTQLNSEAMELLLSRGADTTIKADDGRNIFEIAKDKNIGPALIQLLKKSR